LKQIVGPWYEHGKPQTIQLRPGIGDETGAIFRDGRSTNAIEIDPDFHPIIQTESGQVRMSDERIVGHELGHSVAGTRDSGKGKMDNINQNENPIAQALGLSPRTQYHAPVPQPNVKQEVPKCDKIDVAC
jgi:hypothetical protein